MVKNVFNTVVELTVRGMFFKLFMNGIIVMNLLLGAVKYWNK